MKDAILNKQEMQISTSFELTSRLLDLSELSVEDSSSSKC